MHSLIGIIVAMVVAATLGAAAMYAAITRYSSHIGRDGNFSAVYVIDRLTGTVSMCRADSFCEPMRPRSPEPEAAGKMSLGSTTAPTKRVLNFDDIVGPPKTGN
jgi:hypothetical protein